MRMSFFHVSSGLNAICVVLNSLTIKPIPKIRKVMRSTLRGWKRKYSIVDYRSSLQTANHYLICRKNTYAWVFNESNNNILYIGECNYLLNLYFDLLKVLNEHFCGYANQHPSLIYIWKHYIFLPCTLRIRQIN